MLYERSKTSQALKMHMWCKTLPIAADVSISFLFSYPEMCCGLVICLASSSLEICNFFEIYCLGA